MSKIINQLTSEDFGKSFDESLFSEWKKSAEAHEKASTIMLIFYFIGFAFLIFLNTNAPLFALGLFFLFAFVGLGIGLPKLNKRKKYQRQLGITNRDVKAAIAKCRNRTK